MPDFTSLKYETDDRIAHIVLNRPDVLNAIDQAMPGEIARAVAAANDDDDIHVIVVSGAGRAFCAGYDLKIHAEADGASQAVQEMPWDPMADYRMMKANTDAFASLWRSHKPTVAKVHGAAVAGGSDIALSCDIVMMAHDARIGYPPARVWGCPSSGMWVHRLGPQLAKRMLFTGDLIDGVEAARIGLALEAPPAGELDGQVEALCRRISAVPKNQLMMHKLMINQAVDAMGLHNTQMVATLFDGMARHSPEGLWFKRRAEEAGFHEAVRQRDSGEPIPEGRQATGNGR